MKKNIYLDYAGTAPLDPRVERVVFSHFKTAWGNASSIHEEGRLARGVIENSRVLVAKILGCKADEIVFTGSGTESDNLAIFGTAKARKDLGRHIITTKIEHPAVLRACEYLDQNEGFKVTHLDVGSKGVLDPEDVRKALRPDTIMVSVMYANNEIGTIQPILEIAKVIRDFRNKNQSKTPFFHTDACQAAGTLNLNVNRLGVDLMTLNGSKIYGPKGTGCLYVRRGVDIEPVIVGGSQERGLRAGTESAALIAGFAEALKIADRKKERESARLIKLRNYMIGVILKTIPDSFLNGDLRMRLPNNINVSFGGVDGEMLMLALDQKGIQVSTGSACTSISTEPSHVIKALGLSDPQARGNLRITLGRQTTKKDVDYVHKIMPGLVKKLKHGR